MTDPGRSGWVSSMIAPARELSGRPTQVVVGLIGTQAEELVFAIRISEDGEPALLSTQLAFELIAYARLTMTEKLRIENGAQPS
jgi:uncharacterized membrane protein YeaQ/YmgE (transglycosylase-associated protein family)